MTDNRSNAVAVYEVEQGVPMPTAHSAKELQLVPVHTGAIQAANRGKFAPGVSGNVKGRPKGSRNKLSELFLAAMRQDFAEHGPSAVAQLRERDPGQYLAAIRSLIPANVIAENADKLPMVDDAALSDSEWADAMDAEGNPHDKHKQQIRRNKAVHLVLEGKALSLREALAMLGAALD